MNANPIGRWFSPKTFGFGWTPASWEGWLVTAVGAAAIVAATVIFRP